MEVKKSLTCCVTGHRDLPKEKLEYVRQRLREEVLLAVEEGYTLFLSGFAAGADLEFARIVVDLRDGEHLHLFLEAVLPYAGRRESKDKMFRELFPRCDGIKAVCQEYSRDCYFLRNRDMVQRSERVIAVADGREKGGTVFTINYALTMEKDVRIINI